MRRRRRGNTNNQTFYIKAKSRDIIKLWMLRILIDLNANREFIDYRGGFYTDSIAIFLGLEEYIDKAEENKQKILKIMQKDLKRLKKKPSLSIPKILKQNIKRVKKLININRVERDIVIFIIYLKSYNIMDDATNMLGNISVDKLIYILSILLNHSSSKIKTALSPDGKLARSGLVTVNRSDSYPMAMILDILSKDFANRMMTLDSDIVEMIKDSVRKCSDTILSIDDFDHLDRELSLLLPYMKHSIREKSIGINILFYGQPGTGKTELCKAIAKSLDTDIYEVSYANEYDEPISGGQRLKAYKIGQSFFSNNEVILMFDEIEDVVGDDNSMSFFTPAKQKNKGWMNRVMENNPIPSIWITNDIKAVDPAMIRRFDMSMEIPIPPKTKRKEIIIQDCAEILSEKSIERIAEHEAIAPALLTRAAKVVSSIVDEDIDRDEAFESILNNTLKAQGHHEIPKSGTGEILPNSYDTDYINTDINLKELASSIKKSPNARICLYGVPGTGKSAFGKWIAKYTKRPFLLKKSSDLISKWVGGTEKNIANAFREAKDQNAVLVFDEVDSFLQDRRGANNSWEVTQVNEMLVQMENFDGIFIATTNLISGLEQASLRRFDMKLEFGYLKANQAWRLFVEECKSLDISISDSEQLKREVKSLSLLAPGDFASVRRQNRFRPIESADIFLQRLREELIVKEDSGDVKMGFL